MIMAIDSEGQAVALVVHEEARLRTELEVNLAKYRAALSEQEPPQPAKQEVEGPP
jgi:hypothetical protein